MDKSFASVSLQLHHKERMIAQKRRRVESRGIQSFSVASDGRLICRAKRRSASSRMIRILK